MRAALPLGRVAGVPVGPHWSVLGIVVQQARLDELRAGAQPSSGDPAAAPGVAGRSGGSPGDESTAAEPTSPLRHGKAEQPPSRGRT